MSSLCIHSFGSIERKNNVILDYSSEKKSPHFWGDAHILYIVFIYHFCFWYLITDDYMPYLGIQKGKSHNYPHSFSTKHSISYMSKYKTLFSHFIPFGHRPPSFWPNMNRHFFERIIGTYCHSSTDRIENDIFFREYRNFPLTPDDFWKEESSTLFDRFSSNGLEALFFCLWENEFLGMFCPKEYKSSNTNFHSFLEDVLDFFDLIRKCLIECNYFFWFCIRKWSTFSMEIYMFLIDRGDRIEGFRTISIE